MTAETKSRLQISLGILMILAAVRGAYIFHERNATTPVRHVDDGSRALTADEYVVPKKFYAHDLTSAKTLIGKQVWVKQGYGNLVYPVANGRADLAHGKAMLLPIEQMEVRNVVMQSPPLSWRASRREAEMIAICESSGSASVAVAIGAMRDGDLKLTVNDVFFIQDPHQLYKHWSDETWKAIDAHLAKPGMNELQVNFALGVPQGAGGGDYGDRTLEYSNGGKPVRVSFSNNKAEEIKPLKQD